MITHSRPCGQVCRQHLEVFFRRHPNDLLRSTAYATLAKMLARKVPMPGKAGGWAGGIVYAIGSHGCGVPNAMNRELEEAFGTTMSTIYKRAAHIRRLLDL